MVDSIIGRGIQEDASAQSTSVSHDSAIGHLHSLGLRNKRILPAAGNAPRFMFGSQVSSPMKRQRLDPQPLDPSRRLSFAASADDDDDESKSSGRVSMQRASNV
jgi:hypothetical protein